MTAADGNRIDFWDGGGDGPAVLFVPGSFSTHAAWRGVHRHLPPGYRLAALSLCGYGATDETRTADDAAIAHETRLVAAAARRLGGPVHLVGHSFGATVALAAAVARDVDILSLATFEANPLALLPHRGRDDLHAAVIGLSRHFAAACAAGEAAAAAMIIDYWGGDGTFAAMPDAVRAYCDATAAVNVLDWQTDFGFAVTPADLAALDLPVLLVRGGRTHAAMAEMTAALGAWLPAARTEVVDGAGHFLISTHAEACGRLLAGFLAEVAG